MRGIRSRYAGRIMFGRSGGGGFAGKEEDGGQSALVARDVGQGVAVESRVESLHGFVEHPFESTAADDRAGAFFGCKALGRDRLALGVPYHLADRDVFRRLGEQQAATLA